MGIKKYICHVCWRDPNCTCNDECDWVEGKEHVCDCEHCTEDWDEEPVEGKCGCVCHTPIPYKCPRCKNTGYIEVEVLGEGDKEK